MSSELSKRVSTGVIGGVLLLLLIIIGGKVGTALVTVAISDASTAAIYTLPDKPEKRFVLLGGAWLLSFINFWMPRAEYALLMLTFSGLFAYFLFTAPRHRGVLNVHFQELMFSIFGMIYLVFIPFFLPLLRDLPAGVHWTIVFLLIVWSGDTGAYFAGKKYGRRPLFYMISPKKTVEGALGGLAAGVVITFLYKILLFRGLSWLGILVIPVLVGAVAQIGDLAESFLKRAFGIKDSGKILPGHGGFLDRFDGVVFSLPLMYGLARLFG